MNRRDRGYVNRRRVYRLLTRKQLEVPLEVQIQERHRGSPEGCLVREQVDGVSSEGKEVEDGTELHRR